MDRFQSRIEKQIKEAQDSGKFENLPGYGKPLNLEQNPFEDPTMSMAYHLLRENGFTLPWIELGKEIDLLSAEAQKKLIRTWHWYNRILESRKGVEKARNIWDKAVQEYTEGIVNINKKILNYNLQIPATRFERLQLNPEKFLQDLESKR